MNRLFACILAAIILAATFAGCAVTATRTTPYPTARPDTDFDLTQPGPPGYGMDDNVPYDGYVTQGKHRHYACTLKKRPQQYAADVFLYYTSHRKDTKYACCK